MIKLEILEMVIEWSVLKCLVEYFINVNVMLL